MMSINENIEVHFDPYKHQYTHNGNVLVGATTWLKDYYKPFNSNAIASSCASGWGVTKEEILAIWDGNKNLACDLGNLVENAVQHYDEHYTVGHAISKKKKDGTNPAMPKHPVLRTIVEEFASLDIVPEGATVIPQALITDAQNGRAGLADRLLVLGYKRVRIQDYKANIDADKVDKNFAPLPPYDDMPATKITKYHLQMIYYADMLMKSGWTVEGLDALVYEDTWRVFSLPVLPLRERVVTKYHGFEGLA